MPSKNSSAATFEGEASMNRRQALQQVAWLMGGAISAPALLGILNGCTAKPGSTWQPVFLTEAQGALVEEIAEIMIPRTDTPGAKDIGIGAFIDVMLKDAFPTKDQERFLTGIEALDAQARQQHGAGFLKLDPAQRASLVQTTHDAATAAALANNDDKDKLPRPFILMTKELTLLGYFTSEIGARQVLQYNRQPGVFRGCVALTEAGLGRTWATETTSRF
jgi:gluconate 2-dehydrogenase gamma chain